MEFKILNPTADRLSDAIISQGRLSELNKNLDEMSSSIYGDGGMVLFRQSDVLREIADFCNGPEELAYCIITHLKWREINLKKIM